MNINTKDYWEKRFGSGDWEDKGGFSQSHQLCASQIPHLQISNEFSGVIVDFGCGAGDSFPIYRKNYPNAKLIGVDFSEEAIALCRERFFDIATFICGDYSMVPQCDVIIASNVLEHLDDDKLVVEELSKRCKRLLVIVPFEEFPLCSEHIRSYDINSFCSFKVIRKIVFASRGWSEYGLRDRVIGLHIGNFFRAVQRKSIRKRRFQVLFEILGGQYSSI